LALSDTTQSNNHASEVPTIEMVIVSDPNSSISNITRSSPSNSILSQKLVNKMRPEDVTALDEIFLNALIKIPNLQQVILPPVSGSD